MQLAQNDSTIQTNLALCLSPKRMIKPIAILPHHARAAATESFFNFLTRSHARVTGRCRGQRAVRCTVFDGFLRVVKFKETKLQSAGETVAAADAVENFQFRIFAALEKFSVVPENRAPIILR